MPCIKIYLIRLTFNKILLKPLTNVYNCNIIIMLLFVKKGVIFLDDKKLIISSKKYRGATGVLSTRIPKDLIEKLDKIAEETGRTRNEIVQKCLEFAVDNLELR